MNPRVCCPSHNKADRIPVTEARLAGDKVSDLIEALSRLDPDAKTKLTVVRTFNGYVLGGTDRSRELAFS